MQKHRILGWTSLPLATLFLIPSCSSDDPVGVDDTSTMGTDSGSSNMSSSSTMTSTASSGTTSSLTATVTATTGAGTTTGSGGATATTSGATSSTTATGTGGASSSAGGASSSAGGTSSMGGTSSVGGASSGGGAGGGTMGLVLESPAFADGGMCSTDTPDNCEYFPTANSSFGDNDSPELNWTAGPAGTTGYALIFHDLSNGFGHWAIWNLSAEVLSLPAALPAGATLTDPVSAEQVGLTEDAYFGPGSCMNVYEFKVYALNVDSFTPTMDSPGGVRDQLDADAAGIVLDTATLRARANPEDGNNCQ